MVHFDWVYIACFQIKFNQIYLTIILKFRYEDQLFDRSFPRFDSIVIFNEPQGTSFLI